MMTLLVRALLVLASVAPLVATVNGQDPVIAVPSAYRLVFENDWVRVVRVHYAPKATIAPHFHTEHASAYVYLNDGGPILFKHEKLPYADVTRPATKAGSFRVYKGLKEVHAVENPTETPSEFLRVEFKTEPAAEASLRGKFYREDVPSTATTRQVQFENAQVRIARVVVVPNAPMTLTIRPNQPALVIALSDVRLDGQQLTEGHPAWLGGRQGAVAGSLGDKPSDLLQFDFKTPPSGERAP